MNLKTPFRLASAFLLASLTFFATAAAQARGPLVAGLDHIPVVVGKRFLIITDQSQETSSLNVILNWRPAVQN